MTRSLEVLEAHIAESSPVSIVSSTIAMGDLTILVVAKDLLAAANFLRDDEACGFEQLIDLCGVDFIAYGKSEWDTDGSSFSRGVKREFSFDSDEMADDDTDVLDGQRYAVVIHLLSVKNNQRIRLKAYCEDNEFPLMDSVSEVWNSANWYEREAFDLFGIMFNGHPDLRRILTDYGFSGYPFRKDFPLIGQVEMRYDEEQQRVVYEPVSLQPRVLVPRIIRGGATNKEAEQ